MKTQLVRAAILLVASLGLALGINAVRKDGIPVIRPSKEAMALKSGITPIHLDTAKILLQDPKVLFIDARPHNVWKRGRIPGAISFPEESTDSLIKAFKDTVALDRPLVTYCSGEECRASDMLAQRLQKEGYKYIYLFFGGWVEWSQANEKVEK
jgi:rhodanese-related sulfurtransferase